MPPPGAFGLTSPRMFSSKNRRLSSLTLLDRVASHAVCGLGRRDPILEVVGDHLTGVERGVAATGFRHQCVEPESLVLLVQRVRRELHVEPVGRSRRVSVQFGHHDLGMAGVAGRCLGQQLVGVKHREAEALDRVRHADGEGFGVLVERQRAGRRSRWIPAVIGSVS